jgi:hypothetical protein
LSHVVNRLTAFGRTLTVLLTLACPTLNARQPQQPAPTHTLTPAQLQSLRQFVSENGVDDLPPFNTRGYSHTQQYQYVHLTRDGGRRVFMDTPFGMERGKSVYERLGQQFDKLSGTTER